MGKDDYQMRREAFKFRDLVRLILETLRYFPPAVGCQLPAIYIQLQPNYVQWENMIPLFSNNMNMFLVFLFVMYSWGLIAPVPPIAIVTIL